MEKLTLRSSTTRAKILGAIISISGALVIVLYKGPKILSATSQSPSLALHHPLGSTQMDWILGGLLLAAQYLLVSIWYILQTYVIELYPAELTVVFLYNLCTTFIAAPICLISETNLSAWRLRPDIGLAAIIYSGIFGTCLGTLIHTWGLHVKGPLYIVSFNPLSIAIATAMSVIFLGDALYLGSVVGALILSAGF
ncbi:WAT1-related protein [Quillaja saponaria]|uniref:WAT1-related protein n=1 Tax=Quillaja saponaria TaxID=32244 RepID=A0AAD7VG81_QUISA|nr:WAT1-related protein [Quillaja saponaria]